MNRWLQKRQRDLLPVHYYHLTFSVPHELIPLMWQNKEILFDLMFKTAAATLLKIAADPKHLGAEIGFFGILHTWGQIMNRHPHIHFVVPGGGLSPDHTRWIALPYRFLLPVQVLSEVFCGKFIDGLRKAFQNNRLSTENANDCPTKRPLILFCIPCLEKNGLFTPSRPLAGRSMSCITWDATLTASLYRIIGSYQSPIPK
jgi:hypothetical protein